MFIVDSSTETGQPCGQFVDGSPACILDALKKAIRLLALRRTGMNPSAQVGLVEWGRTPRWKFFPRSISSDHASLDAIFDKLHPATANEELCGKILVTNTTLHITACSCNKKKETFMKDNLMQRRY